jgi:hypothetical protein
VTGTPSQADAGEAGAVQDRGVEQVAGVDDEGLLHHPGQRDQLLGDDVFVRGLSAQPGELAQVLVPVDHVS